MTGVTKTARLTARIASRYASKSVVRRGFQMSAQDRAAQNYTMPALSPTMTEGNIANWRVKEGDSYSAGDVLLEIETDKATMDVEAQDDGILMKITAGDGTKGIKVGSRIGVMAEPGDDISSLQIPAENKSSDQKSAKEAPKEEPPESKSDGKAAKELPKKGEDDPATQKHKTQHGKHMYPLHPAVEAILRQNGLSEADVGDIKATGPKGRILKGDVLAHLGKISKDSPAKVSERVGKLAHLDLSNIQLAKKPEMEAKGVDKAPGSELPTATEVAIPISLSSVIATQKRVQDTLGIFLPLSTFITRASELANDDLPLSKNAKATADDLFNALLGLDKVPKSSKGFFHPQITGISPAPLSPVRSSKKPDIIDLLASKKAKASKSLRVVPVAAPGISPSGNVFSVVAKTGDERRAEEYLERMKLVLEKEPGRLVL